MSTASRRWVKVWHEILIDHDFQDMPLEQQARWYNLLVFVSANGEKGNIEIDLTSRTISNLLQCQTHDILPHLMSLKNVEIKLLDDNAKISVTFKKWAKYQIDSTSYERVKKYRKTHSCNGNDNASKNKIKNKNKNKEKDINTYAENEKLFSAKEENFEKFWEIYPARNGKKLLKDDAKKFFIEKIKDEDFSLLMKAVENYAISKTVTDGFAKDAIRFLKKDFWRSWIEPETPTRQIRQIPKTASNWELLKKRQEEGVYDREG